MQILGNSGNAYFSGTVNGGAGFVFQEDWKFKEIKKENIRKGEGKWGRENETK